MLEKILEDVEVLYLLEMTGRRDITRGNGHP
jgi:hypothetical protein